MIERSRLQEPGTPQPPGNPAQPPGPEIPPPIEEPPKPIPTPPIDVPVPPVKGGPVVKSDGDQLRSMA
jgi:hypothetical protein